MRKYILKAKGVEDIEKPENEIISFSEDIAQEIGISKRTAQRVGT